MAPSLPGTPWGREQSSPQGPGLQSFSFFLYLLSHTRVFSPGAVERERARNGLCIPDLRPNRFVYFRHQPKPRVMDGTGAQWHSPCHFGKTQLSFAEVSVENQCAARQPHRLQGQTLPHPLMPGSLPSPAQTKRLEFQVWGRGSSTGQFPADRALFLGPDGFAVMWRLQWICAGSLCPLELPQLPAEPVQEQARACVWWVQYFLPERPNKVFECATETVPVLGCRENLNSPSPTGRLTWVCSALHPPQVRRLVPKFRCCVFVPCQEDKRVGKTVT